jgi:hypothetical protein
VTSKVRKVNGRQARRALVAGVLAIGGLVTASGIATPTSRATAGTATRCANGTAASRPGSVCEVRGGVEPMSETQALQGQLTAREGGGAAGAFRAATLQNASLPVVGNAWQPYGNTPECAGSSGGSPCPAGTTANGNYSSTGTLGYHALSGRITSFAIDPGNGSHLWASPVGGGVFETTNAGASWTSVGDGLPTQYVGAIAYDAPLHELIVGTGDNSFGGDGISGHGIFLSTTDGAGSWTVPGVNIPDLSLSFRIVVSPADLSGKTIYAATSKGLFRSADGGLTWANENLPTTPSGYSPNCAGNTSDTRCFFANIVTDVVVKGTMSTAAPAGAVMAVVGWRAGQRPDPGTGCLQASTPIACRQSPQNGLYISTDGSPGSFTWSAQGTTLPTTTGFSPNQVVGRTALGIASGAGQSSDAVYALVEDATKFNGCIDPGDLDQACLNPTASAASQRTYVDGMYATYDFGGSWTKIMDWSQLQQAGTGSALLANTSVGYGPGVQAWYNLWVLPDPTASKNDPVLGKTIPTRVAFGLEEVWENNQTAETVASNPLTLPYQSQAPANWVTIGRYWNACAGLNVSTPLFCNPTLNSSATELPGTTTHPDQHAAVFVPDSSGGGETLWIGSDGGAWNQHIASGGDFDNAHWGEGLNVGINSQQAYDAEMSADGTVVEGLQDNGQMLVQPSGAESEIMGGDAFFTTIDPGNSKNILEEYTYGATSVSTDGGNSWTSITPSNCSSTTALFSTPLEQDATQAGHVVEGCTHIYEATNLYSSQTWTDAYTIPAADCSSGACIPSALGVRGSTIYAGFCGFCDTVTGGVPFSSGIVTNLGGTWHMVSATCSPSCGTANGKLPQRYITSVQIDPSDPNTVYVTLGAYGRRWVAPGAFGESTSNIGNGNLFKSTDGGATFTDITGNLPPGPANWTVVHGTNLIAATDLGVYIAPTTAGGSWSQLGNALPNTPVFTLRVDPGNPNLLLAGTYGRGAWTLDISTLASAVPETPIAALVPLSSIALVGGFVAFRRRRRKAHVVGV